MVLRRNSDHGRSVGMVLRRNGARSEWCYAPVLPLKVLPLNPSTLTQVPTQSVPTVVGDQYMFFLLYSLLEHQLLNEDLINLFFNVSLLLLDQCNIILECELTSFGLLSVSI